MDGKTATILTAAAALTAGPALAEQTQATPVASSYAELLQPIPNAVERLKIADREAAERPAHLIEAQYYYYHHHHHHHHHHHSRWWYRQNGYSWYGGGWVYRPRYYHHHHHHHHHHHYYYDYY